jgi:uncharacterized protein (DUF3084 family)
MEVSGQLQAPTALPHGKYYSIKITTFWNTVILRREASKKYTDVSKVCSTSETSISYETVRRNISPGCQHHIRRRENRKLTQLQQPQNRRLGVSQSRLDAVAKTNSTVHVENQTPTTHPIDSHCTELSRLKSARSLPRKFCLPLNTTI